MGFAVLPNNETVPCMDCRTAVYSAKMMRSKFFKRFSFFSSQQNTSHMLFGLALNTGMNSVLMTAVITLISPSTED